MTLWEKEAHFEIIQDKLARARNSKKRKQKSQKKLSVIKTKKNRDK